MPPVLNRAAVLLMLRQGRARTPQELADLFRAYDSGQAVLDSYIDDLIRAGLVECDKQLEHCSPEWPGTVLRVSNALSRIQTALGLSLAELAGRAHTDMIVRSFFGRPQLAHANQDVFVLMPFKVQLRPVYNRIKKVASALGLTTARADDFAATSVVMQQVWDGICNCRLTVADCTGRNPNVFYEIGLAHAVGKPVVLITQNRAHIPFDIGHIRYIHYKLKARGMKEFEANLTTAIEAVVEG